MPPNSEIEKLERRWRDNPKGTVFAPYAEVLRKNGDHALAREVLRQGLELHPDHIPGNIVLGRCCLDLGEDGPAEGAFAHVLDLDPENVIALKALADITERQGRLAEADSWLSRLMAVDPSNDEARDQSARVNAARESAAVAMTSEVAAGSTAVKTVEVRVDDLAAQDKQEVQDRSEAGSGSIDEMSEVAALADKAFDSFLSEIPEPTTPPPAAEATMVTPAFSAAPPVSPAAAERPAGLETTEVDLSEPGPELEPIADLKLDEAFSPPPATGATGATERPSGPFAIGRDEPAEIEIRPSGASEFQAPDDSTELLGIAPGKSEFQVPDASADLNIAAAGSSEFQTPDASEELRVSGHGSSEYQTPSGADELLHSSLAGETTSESEPEPEPVPPSWTATEVSGTIASLAAMPTQEIPTEPPPESAHRAPSWFFEEEESSVPPPVADLPLIDTAPVTEPEPAEEPAPPAPPEPVAAEAEPEPEPAAEPPARSTAELKLIFPDDAAQPEPHKVRRITEAELAQPEEPAETSAEEPEPVVTESMAELYARQGHVAEALKVYRTLSAQQPGDSHLRERIRELEARTGGTARRHTYVAADTGGESVESFFRSLAEARPGSGAAPAGFDAPTAAEDNGGAPTRPARDPLSLSAIFGEEPSAAAARKPETPAVSAPPPGPDAFSFDQFFGAPPSSGSSTGGSRPSGASDEDLDQFQNWLKSLKR